MERRNFLIGMGSTAAGASALIGSGAFSRVESHRSVTVQVANDEEAYLGMKPLSTPNSNNFVELDENGHLEIDVGEHSTAEDEDLDVNEPAQGVNSDSITYFDGMFELCNQGKADATISYELPDGVVDNNDAGEQTVAFYYIENDEREIVEEGDEVLLQLGECEEIGLRTVTKGIDADDGPLIDGDVVITAEASEAGE